MKRRAFMNRIGLAAVVASTVPSRSLHGQNAQWERDGVGTVGRLGVLTPDFDPVPESELWAMAPAGVSIHAARVAWKGDARTFAEPPHVDQATERLVGLSPRAILFAFTSSSYELGAEAESRVRDRLEQRANGVPIILTCQAAVTALRSLGVRRLSLIHPPWFSDASNEQGRSYFGGQKFEVVGCTPIRPPRSFTEVAPSEVFAFVSASTPGTADAVFIGGNGLRAVGAIRALEARLRKPVLTANQALMWAALRASRTTGSVTRYGRVFVN
jgi:maleate isomerase